MEISGKAVLVINCGSSTIKFALLTADAGERIASGLADRLGTTQACFTGSFAGEKVERALPDAGHGEAIESIIELLDGRIGDRARPVAVGHRVVHGGEYFSAPTLLDEAVIARIEECARFAPLHNPANARGIRIAKKAFPDLPHVGVFDTAFHQSMPDTAYMYAIPHAYYDRHRLRRYGAHGTSHEYVAGQAALRIGRPLSELNLIVAHLGNGCSVCAVAGGRSVDTSMGLTPLEGLMMGTRSGDVDASLHLALHELEGLDLREITDVLNKKSGLLGVSELSNDMRTIIAEAEQGNAKADLARRMFSHRLAKAVLAMAASLERVDALVFTAGIGENSAATRAGALAHLRILNPEIDDALNASHGAGANGRITRDGSPGLLALVVPTDEERMIARAAIDLCDSLSAR